MTIENETGTSQDAGSEVATSDVQPSTGQTVESTDTGDTVKPADTSIRSAIKAATEEIEKREKSPARQAAAEKRARDGTGKFTAAQLAEQATAAAAKDKEASAPKPAAAASSTVPPADKSATSDTGAATQAVAGEPPAALSKEIKAAWPTLPENIRQEFLRREQDTQRGVEQLRSRYQPIDDAIAPYRPLLQQRGLNEGQAVKQLFDWHMALAGPNKVRAFQELARSHGVDLSAFAPRNAETSPNAAAQTTDPDPFAPRLAPIMTQMQTLQQRIEAQEAQRQQDANARTQSEIANFAKDKPHFNAVRETMGRLLASGIAADLNDAYDKATRFVPEVATAMAQEQEAKRAAELAQAAEAEKLKATEAEAARQRTDAAHAAKARTASASVRGGPPTGSGKPLQKAQSVRDTVAAAWKEATGDARV